MNFTFSFQFRASSVMFQIISHNHISVEGCIWMPNHLSGNAVAWTDIVEFDNNRLQGAVAHTASSQQTSNVCRLLLQGLQKWFLFQSCVTFERLTTATKEPSYSLKWFNLHAIEWKLFWHVLALVTRGNSVPGTWFQRPVGFPRRCLLRSMCWKLLDRWKNKGCHWWCKKYPLVN